MATSEVENFDVIVIGGGPGGSTTGTYLALDGKKTLILERERFPRFHIGESLLPYGNDILKETGAWEKVEKHGFMPKLGAEFCTGNNTRFHRFWFERGLGPDYAQTFQVERSRFDHVLLQHAAESGCDVREGCLVTEARLDDTSVTLLYQDGITRHEVRARWLVDATGRDTFIGRQMNLPREPTQLAKRIATYAHFKNVFRNEGRAAGHITVARVPDGWFWFIPLDGEKTSVGYVQSVNALKRTGLKPEESFERIIRDFPELRARLDGAERVGAFHVTSDYSYRFGQFAMPRCLMVGDAAGFVDPIFSSGVLMALKSGRMAAQLISNAEVAGRALTDGERKRYTKEVRRMMDVYIGMITAFYDDTSFEVFMSPAPALRIHHAVLAIIGGNTDLPFSLWWRMKAFYLICKLQRWFAISPRVNYAEPPAGPAA